jgi:hypothetical protein
MDEYRRLRTFYKDISESLTIAAGTGDTTLVTARNSSSTIYVQQVIMYITTDAAQNASFEDSTGVIVCKVSTSPGVDTRWAFDFGSRGRPLTQGANFVLNVSAAGLAGHIEWYGYSKLSSAVAAGTTN